jgi:dolichol-phosphate mannosyltransferase
MDTPLLSVVIPIHDEADNVAPLAEEVARVFAATGIAWEAVWVDDGSTDGGAQQVRALPPPHRLVRLDRNHGQSAACMAGFQAARGEWVGTLDGDGQNDPADLPRQLVHALVAGVDMVNGIRVRRHDSLVRRASSRIGNAVRAWITGEREVADVGCSTRVVRRAALAGLPFFHGMHRFLPTLVRMRGGRLAQIAVNHRPRRAGRSKYGIANRLWVGLCDCVGVRWLQARHRGWLVLAEESAPPAAAPPVPAPGAAAFASDAPLVDLVHSSLGMRRIGVGSGS